MANQKKYDHSLNPDALEENHFGYLSDLSKSEWTPPTRISVLMLGAIGLILSTKTRGGLRKALSLFGWVTLIRAITNRHVTDLIGWVANPAVQLSRTFQIKAPVEDVYEYLSNFSNYSTFMSYVKKVEVNEIGGLKWTVDGPGGTLFHWNTSLGTLQKNQAISWTSSVNSFIRNSGQIYLTDCSGGITQVQIELRFAPPVGILGYAVVHFLGFDPAVKIDEDLRLLKSIIERNYSPDTLTDTLINVS